MPSHSERVRRNYRCAECDGTGRVFDYDGDDQCLECDGAGVILYPKAKPAPRALTPQEQAMADLLADQGIQTLINNLAFIQEVNRPFEVGDAITVKLPPRWRRPSENTAEQLARRADLHAGEVS